MTPSSRKPDRSHEATAPKPGLRARIARAARFVRRRYAHLDRRTLGLYRIAIGTLLCLNCIRIWLDAELYYSDAGVLSSHWHLFRPSSEFNFSLFHAFGPPWQVHIAFAAAFACFFLFAAGYRTKLFNVLSFIWITSLDNRLVMVENGGYVVVNLSVFWALFLPTGERFSLDALRRRWRGLPQEISRLGKLSRDAAPHVSLASLFLLLNFATIYIFNVVNKYGSTWREGMTVHYVLHLDRLATPVAAWVREVLPYWATVAATWGVLIVEAMIVMMILWPHGRRWSRPLAMLLIVGLHATFGVMMQLGPFSWFMIGWSTCLLGAVHWEAATRWWRARRGGVEVSVDGDSRVGTTVARLLALADGPGCLSFAEHRGGAPIRLRREGTWIEGREAVMQAAGATPILAVLLPPLRLLSLGLVDGLVAWATAKPERAAAVLGLASPPPPREPRPPSPVGRRLRRWGARLRGAVVVLFVALFVSQIINENKSIPKALKHDRPKAVRALVVYPRLFQGWGMFAPNPVREDGVLAIDAITVDGRHIDPLRGAPPDLNLSDDRSCGLNQIHQDYGNRIRKDSNRTHRTALRRFLNRYHEITGHPEDELVYYAVWWLRDQCPEPGRLEPTDHEKICLLGYRRRGFRLPSGERLPPRCKVRSAEKKDEDE